MNSKLILDFDSTFIKDETLDEIARYKVKSSTLSDESANEIKRITNLAMEASFLRLHSPQRLLAGQVEK